MLGGYAGDGDWRAFFLTRDEVAKVTPDDVTRVAKAYLKSSNRTLGEFIPTTAPDRAEIPATPDPAARFKDYKGGAAIQQGEVFDPTPQNIEARVIRATLPNGLKLVMFPKKTRGGTVVATLNVRFGDEKSLFGKCTDGDHGRSAADARHQEQEPPADSGRNRPPEGADQRHRRRHERQSPASAPWRRTSPIPCASPANCCASPRSPKPNSSRSASSASPTPKRQDRAQHPGLASTWTGT